MKKISSYITSLILSCVIFQPVYAINTDNQINYNRSGYVYFVEVINETNDDYDVNYQSFPNNGTGHWHYYYMPSKGVTGSQQTFNYMNPPDGGLYFQIIRRKDQKTIFYGMKSRDSIVLE